MSGTIKETTPANMNPKGSQRLTTITSNTALTIPPGSSHALLQAETANVRFDDGTDTATDLTATTGMLLVAGGQPFPYVGDLSKLRFRGVDNTAILNVLFYAQSGS